VGGKKKFSGHCCGQPVLAGNHHVGLIFITGYHDWPMGANTTNYMFQAGCRGVAKREENLKSIPIIFCMACKRKSHLAAAACAREAQHIQATSHSYDP
jgi:hypothetical protein